MPFAPDTTPLPASRIYYHGTNHIEAIRSLMAGGPLRNGRPDGKPLGDFPPSQKNRVYLTPSLRLAKDYARIYSREDRPFDDDDVFSGEPHVFVFDDFSGTSDVMVDEDDVGWSALDCYRTLIKGNNVEFNANHEFCANFRQSMKSSRRSLLDYYLSVAIEAKSSHEIRIFIRTTQDLLSGRMPELKSGSPHFWARIGLGLAPLLSNEVASRLLKLGANICASGQLRPSGYILLNAKGATLAEGALDTKWPGAHPPSSTKNINIVDQPTHDEYYLPPAP